MAGGRASRGGVGPVCCPHLPTIGSYRRWERCPPRSEGTDGGWEGRTDRVKGPDGTGRGASEGYQDMTG